jgi:predicted amidohydrolase
MRIGLAQIRSETGDVEKNIEKHLFWIQKGIDHKLDLIVFPELSLTAYEPQLSDKLALVPKDPRLNVFQDICDKSKISIGIGLPLKDPLGIKISMLFYFPENVPSMYAKQQLHDDELSYFIPGNEQLIFEIGGYKIAPAICYEAFQIEHLENAISLGADLYLASVAKSKSGVKEALEYFPKMAEKYKLPIVMVNSIGYCDNFLSYGMSSIWDEKGEIIAKLESENEGVLVFDLDNSNLLSRKSS